MSLKVFHVLFITIAIILCAGCAAWGLATEMTPYFSWSCAATAAALIVYEFAFIRKAKTLIT